MIVTLLGVLSAGGAYLALDPHGTPAARLAEIVRDAGAPLVIADRPVPDAPVPVIEMSSLSRTPRRDIPRPRPTDVRNLAYVSYTSGSTGAPKGVAVSHEAVARLVQSPPWAPMSAEETVLCLSPVAFDASTFEIWGPLCNGGRLVVAPPGPVRLDELAGLIDEAGVTTAWFTAGLFHQLVDAYPQAFAGLRHVLAGGDVLSADHVNRLRQAYPALRVTNGYGPSENTTFTTCWSADGWCGPSVPIGRPIPGSSVAILDDDLRPVPIGVPGELYAGGAGVARGYLGRPGATADRFVPDPAGPGRLYRTGDTARWRPDGVIDFCGRTDFQVKIRGYRVELGGIEAVLEQQPEVREAIVVAESDALSVQRLVAYVRLDDRPRDTAESQAAAARLRRRLGEILPSYLVPALVVPMVEFPMTSSGKIDRARLGTGMRAPRALARRYVAPRSDAEARLAAIWAGVLRVEPVGVEDNFFELGGHSLSVAQLILEMEAEFGRPVPARTVFLQPTVADLAVALTGTGLATGEGAARPDGGEPE
jgi:amino acid adenylation domain-containing protein